MVKTSPSANNLYAGFFGDAIGVGSRNEGSGQPCGRIDPSQKLVLDLSTALSGKLIDYAEIDVEGKFGATIQVQGFFVDPADPSNPIPVDPEPIQYPTTGPDSSPDSGDLDNFRIRYPKTGTTLVNRLEFTIAGSTGGASLEGGSDGTSPCNGFTSDGTTPDQNSLGCQTFSLGGDLGTTDTLFHLTEVEGFLDCGDVVTDEEPNDGIGLTIERLDNANGGCGDPIPYNLSASRDSEVCSSAQCIFLQKDLLGQDDARFYWTVTWFPTTEDYMPGATQFDFGDGRGFHALDFCLADDPADPGTDPELPDNGDPWCVVSTSSTLDPSSGDVTVLEQYFGQGDPTGRR